MICIDIDGKVTERKYNGNLQEIYDAIGATLFDIVMLRGNALMFVDDEGLMKEGAVERINWKATYLRMNQWMENPQEIDWNVARTMLPPTIVGNVCILEGRDDGETVDIGDAARELVLETIGESVL